MTRSEALERLKAARRAARAAEPITTPAAARPAPPAMIADNPIERAKWARRHGASFPRARLGA